MQTDTPVAVAERVRVQLLQLGLLRDSTSDTTVRPILNWGGFVNFSFAAADPDTAFHVKLVDGSESRSALQRWMANGPTLSARYNAPEVHSWIEIPGTPFEGLVLEWIEGVTPDAVSGAVRQQAVALASALHGDQELAQSLSNPLEPVRSCADAFVSTFGKRFAADLEGIRVAPPPFVHAEAFAWMTSAAARLVETVRASGSFAAPVTSAIHGDLWINNLMVEKDGNLRIVDWDDMELGDPMMDWATLLGPSRDQLTPARLASGELDHLTAAERERLALYAQATMLDWVIDPLADWIEAERAPSHRDEVRAANEKLFPAAVSCYRALYE